MQDLNDKVTGNDLTADEWNEVPSEIQNAIEASGQTLSSGDLNQLRKAVNLVVDTFDDLRLLTSGMGTVFVNSNAIATDSGGGTFYWDSTSTTADDDDTVIKLTSVTTGRYLRLYYPASRGIDDNATSTQLTLSDTDATFGGDISLGDNKFLYLGAGSDLRAHHDGSNSYIDNYTGVLQIRERVNSALIYLTNYNSVGAAKTCIITGGATPYVRLHYDGIEVVRTTSSGLDLQPGNQITQDLTTDNKGFIDFKATADADATSAISTLTTSGATTHHIQVEINGVRAWIAASTNNPT